MSAARRNRSETAAKRDLANESLRRELHDLRAALASIVEGYEVRLGGRINDMLRTLEGDDSLDQPPHRLTTARAQAALDEIRRVRLHTEKPRLRDLRRIQKLVRRLRSIIPD